MKYLKGFRKNYFSFSAMIAYSTAKSLGDSEVRSKKAARYSQFYLENEDDEAPPFKELLLVDCAILKPSKPCHCDCFFKLKTKLAVHIFKFIPRCPYYTTYFAFRRTGVHPPLFIL
ncbi:hypothetical protein CRV08_05420 [Halarcobacter ebronensis]|uniref:Uncharacterized protein n=1 Tax=Halarcobacter ebronensis TaxID=1462615 RepID=A0A4V1LRP1_9BACT|nr:hypothetical protein [Halarcobacter ebronensis]RXJ68878.1 hypothetical protein CRV08_05420 [Halarcobacter ebronensis]